MHTGRALLILFYLFIIIIILFFYFFAVALRPNAGHSLLILEVFLDHTQRRTTVGRNPLDE